MKSATQEIITKKTSESTEQSRLFGASSLTRCSYKYKTLDKSQLGGCQVFTASKINIALKKKFTIAFENNKPCESLNSERVGNLNRRSYKG